jgi:hypothetical protein
MRTPQHTSVNLAHGVVRILTLISALSLAAASAGAAPTCPLSYGTTDAAKSHKLYLYFPTADDASFPNGGTHRFDVAELTSGIGTTAALRDRIQDVVIDDFCELNIQVLQTTTNPELMGSPPPLRHTEAIGSDAGGGFGTWGSSPTSNADVLTGHVWAGAYVTCEGGDGAGNCSMQGALTGANNTLDRWAQAIGGTAAHESGHTYGLNHSDDDGPGGSCPDPGPGPEAGEDALTRHLMPSGCNLDGNSRAGYRRHVSNRGYGILATNVGLSIQTMHNWDLVNPNAQAGRSLAIDFLSSQSSINISWSWTGASSPWIDPVVSATGTGTYHGTSYHKYRITWSTPNPAWGGGPAGTVNGGGQFHIGATFTGVDFNQPDPIIIQNVTLFDASSAALVLHPRLPIYDAGSLDAADGAFSLHFGPPLDGAPLMLQEAVIYQLPRVASIDSMNGSQRPFTFDRQPIEPWSETRCEPQALRERPIRCVIAHIEDRPHVLSVHKVGEPNVYDCSNGIPWERVHYDSKGNPDSDGPICAASVRDPFPSTTVYVIATFVDPAAKHWDPKQGAYVNGPVVSKVYYQFAGVRDPGRLREQQTESENGSRSGLDTRRLAIGYFIGGYLFDKDFPVDREILYGFRFGVGLNDRIDLESEIALASAHDAADRHGFITDLNLLAAVSLGSGKVHPFASLGVGWFDFSEFSPGVDTSGLAPFLGVGWKFHVRPQLTGRLEGRYLNFSGLDVKADHHAQVLWGIDIGF